MLSCLDFIRDITPLSVFTRMLIAVICGGLIGIERESKRRPAGFRTHILICLGAAMTTMTSQYLYLNMHMFTDIARLGAQVIAGIGFIGAGAIIVTKHNQVKGLTTAAGLWTAAIIGLACGAGYIECAVAATALILISELLLIKLEHRIIRGSHDINMFVEYEDAFAIEKIMNVCRESWIHIQDLEISKSNIKDEQSHFCAMIVVRQVRQQTLEKLINSISSIDGVISVEEI